MGENEKGVGAESEEASEPRLRRRERVMNMAQLAPSRKLLSLNEQGPRVTLAIISTIRLIPSSFSPFLLGIEIPVCMKDVIYMKDNDREGKKEKHNLILALRLKERERELGGCEWEGVRRRHVHVTR